MSVSIIEPSLESLYDLGLLYLETWEIMTGNVRPATLLPLFVGFVIYQNYILNTL